MRVNITIISILFLLVIMPVYSANPKVVCFAGERDEVLQKCNAIAEDCSVKQDLDNNSVLVCGIEGAVNEECNSDNECDAGFICEDNQCIEKEVECNSNEDCGDGFSCENNNCVQIEDNSDDEQPLPTESPLPAGVSVSGGSTGGKAVVFDIKKDNEVVNLELKVEPDPVDNIEKPKLNLNFNVESLSFIPETIYVKPNNLLSKFYFKFLIVNLVAILLVFGFIIKDMAIVHPRKY